MAAVRSVVLLAALIDPRIAPLLDRVSEEARVFAEKCPNFLGVEHLAQRGRVAPPRFRLRRGANSSDAPATAFRTTEMVSEYGFGSAKGSPDIHELRVVVSVNGKTVRDRKQARQELTGGMTSDQDRLVLQMLLDLEKHGMVGAVADLGQLLLMFTRGQLNEFEFSLEPDAAHDSEPVTVIGYRQNSGTARVYHTKAMSKVPLSGQIWVRKSDGRPVRVTAGMAVKEGRNSVVHDMSADYTLSNHGVLLPARTAYSRTQDGLLLVENKYTYSDFKMFSADVEIKFLAEGDEQKQ
jgi:hypothetical protein